MSDLFNLCVTGFDFENINELLQYVKPVASDVKRYNFVK